MKDTNYYYSNAISKHDVSEKWAGLKHIKGVEVRWSKSTGQWSEWSTNHTPAEINDLYQFRWPDPTKKLPESQDPFPRTPAKPGYEGFAAVLDRALEQTQSGKGAERHADGNPFEQQPMMRTGRLFPGFLLGQVEKKILESRNLPKGKAIHDLLGAISYLVGEVIRRGEEP